MTDDINHARSETPSDESGRFEVDRPETPISEPMVISSQDEVADDMGIQNVMDYDQNIPTFSEGDVVQGVVVHIDREGVLVDVGMKSEGIIHRNELSRDANAAAEDIVKVGEKIDVYVMEAETQDGNLILSKKRADFEKAWERVKEAKDQNKTLVALVTDRVKGGLVVDLGIRGFVPASHVGNGSLKNNLDKFVGQSISLKVIEVDKDRRKVVLSNKMALDEERDLRKAETAKSLEVGQIRKGIVRRLTTYGAFVDLGGIDGLLHISEMSWSRINHPQEEMKEGDEIDVIILKMDLESGKVSLGRRQILPDPWKAIEDKYHIGDLIKGPITRIVPFGAFMQIEGLEGIIPNSEVTGKKGGKAAGNLEQGREVEAMIIDMKPEERKITLSIAKARQETDTRQEQTQIEEFQHRSNGEQGAPRFTIGDALKAKEDTEPESEQ